MVLVAALLSGATSYAQVDVSGTWNLCLAPGPSNPAPPARPVATLVQVGAHVAGTVVYPFFGSGTLSCSVGFDIDPATGAFVPGAATEQCQFGATFGLRPAVASEGRIDGEHRSERTAFYGLRACDPMVIGACDDRDLSTTDTCSTTVDCFGAALAGSCIHTGCTTDADCTDAHQCTFDRCDAATGCAHPVLLQPGDPPPFCEDGDACSVNDQCNLSTCGPGPTSVTVTSVGSLRLTLGRLGAPAGDDTLVMKGRVTLPAPLAIYPSVKGIQVSVLDANGAAVVDEEIQGGTFNPLTGVGWSSNGKGLRYADKRKIGQMPIRKVSIKSTRATPGLVRFGMAGKAGTYPGSPALPLNVFVNLGGSSLRGGACATFPGPSPVCTTSRAGTKIRCR